MTGASGDQNFLSLAKLLGARHILQKPFGEQELQSAVNYSLIH